MNKLSNQRNVLVAALLGIAATPCMAADSGWNWDVAPYLWASSITTDFQVRGQPVGGETEFADIVDKLDYAFQIHIEGQGDDFGVFADYTYLKLSDEINRDAVGIDASLDNTLFEAALVWSPGEERHRGFEAFAGVRYLNTGIDVKFDLTNPAQTDQRRTLDSSFTDAMVGARYIAQLADKWTMTVRGDGSFGDTEGSYNGSLVFQYHTGGGAWAFGYRYLDVEMETTGENANVYMAGPMFGYVYKF